jgi:preprotein translocase subunit YajC
MFDWIIASSYAETAAAANQPSAMASLIPFALIFVVFYFFMIKPQKKKMEQERNFLSALKKGDEIFTKSGIIGTIIGMTDKIITLEIADGIKIKLLRSQVGGAASTIFNEAPTQATSVKAVK